MLRRLDAKVPDHLEEPLIGLADLLGLSCFSSPCLIDSGEGGAVVLSGINSTNASRLEQSLGLHGLRYDGKDSEGDWFAFKASRI